MVTTWKPTITDNKSLTVLDKLVTMCGLNLTELPVDEIVGSKV